MSSQRGFYSFLCTPPTTSITEQVKFEKQRTMPLPLHPPLIVRSREGGTMAFRSRGHVLLRRTENHDLVCYASACQELLNVFSRIRNGMQTLTITSTSISSSSIPSAIPQPICWRSALGPSIPSIPFQQRYHTFFSYIDNNDLLSHTLTSSPFPELYTSNPPP